MVKITLHNIKMVDEDLLCEELDRLFDLELTATAIYKAIEKELEDRAERFTKLEELRKQREKERIERVAALRLDIENALSRMTDERKRDVLIRHFGHHFADDYEVTYDFIVISKVAKQHHQGEYHCDNQDEADEKLSVLLYYRIYDSFFRDTDDEERLIRFHEALLT